tara:strand:+ start:135 stop:335 length:201 start_codon:yes stop_codon:yes gene_type:complete
MGEFAYATESVSPVIALLFPFFPVLILLGFYFAAGGGFNDDDDDDSQGGKGIRVMQPQPIPVPSGA